jgi:hypothetical protein
MFIEHLKRRVLNRRYAQGWSLTRSTSSTAYFENFQAWVCSNFVKKTFRRPVIVGRVTLEHNGKTETPPAHGLGGVSPVRNKTNTQDILGH